MPLAVTRLEILLLARTPEPRHPNAVQRMSPKVKDNLEQKLRAFQIFFITISGVIGGGIVFNDGAALRVAGPIGVLISVVLVGIITMCVMDCIAELVQLFPTPIPIFHYIKTFLDEDLAWIVGVAYWYTYAALFAIQNASAAETSKYWYMPDAIRSIVFHFIIPLILTVLNLLPVYVYGWTETIGGVLKICFLLGVAAFLYTLGVSAGEDHIDRSGFIDEGLDAAEPFAKTVGIAESYAIPLIAFSYLSIDTATVTAREARTVGDLKLASIAAPWVIFVIYLMVILGEITVVSWTDDSLSSPFAPLNSILRDKTPSKSFAMPIIAAQYAINKGVTGLSWIPGFLNGCIILSQLSSGNTGLYLASRTLHGLALQIDSTSTFDRRFQGLSYVSPFFHSPSRAVAVSAILFAWVPFLQLSVSSGAIDVINIIANSLIYSLVIVWALVCLAFLRFYIWLHKHANEVAHERPRFNRGKKTYAFTLLGWAQPVIAMIGCLGSVLIIVTGSAQWWSERATFTTVAGVYGSPIVLFVAFVALKLKSLYKYHKDSSPENYQRLRVPFPRRSQKLIELLDDLEYLKVQDSKSKTSSAPPAEAESMESPSKQERSIFKAFGFQVKASKSSRRKEKEAQQGTLDNNTT